MIRAQTTRTDDYRGRIVYRSETVDLLVEVIDTDSTRALHFGTPARQSCMWLHDPQRLQLPYTRAMMSFLLLLPHAPRRVLLLGLGGGSIAKFLLHGFPACEVHAVECSAEVVSIARRFFELPETDRLQVHVERAEHFVARPAVREQYDAVLVDTFDAAGAADCLTQQQFIDDCKTALAAGGALVLNLWRGRASGCRQTLAAMGRSFAQAPLRLPVAGRGNLIALAANDPRSADRLQQLGERANAYERRFELNFATYLHQLQRSRHGWLHWLRRQ